MKTGSRPNIKSTVFRNCSIFNIHFYLLTSPLSTAYTVSAAALWLPVIVSAALCWIAGAVIWMALPHHKSDFKGLPDEQAARNALSGIAGGQYNIPNVSDPSKLSDEDRQKFADGPVGFLTVLPNGFPNMGRNLVQQIIYLLVVSAAVAYVAGASLPAGTDYLKVFRIVGTVAWLAYGFALIQESIWFGKPWSHTAKTLADAFVYALLTAGVFGWLWP